MIDFKTFKANRSSMVESIAKIGEERKNNMNKDNWFPTIDQNGNAYAVIRILPQKDTCKHPIQTVYKHKTDSKSIMCPSTFGTMKDCPLCQIASKEYKRLKDMGEQFPKVPTYRKAVNVANILVVKDPSNPEMEGKVKKFYLPKDLVDKINNKLLPPTDANGLPIKTAEMIHDLWEGKNLTIIIKKGKNGFNDYSNCEFAAEKTPVAPTDEKIEEIYNNIFNLEPDKASCVGSDKIIEEWNSISDVKVNVAGSAVTNKTVETPKPQANKTVEKQTNYNMDKGFNLNNISDSKPKAEEPAHTEEVNSNNTVLTNDEVLPWD